MPLGISILVITLFSLIINPGYKVFTGDQAVYLPQIYHLENPSLFTNDLLIHFDQLKYTLFDELIIILTNKLHLDIFITFFILTLIVRFIYYYALYQLALYFSKNHLFSFLITLIFIPGFFVYGYPYSTVDIILIPRSISLSLNLLFLALFFNKKYFLSLIPLILALLFHPISSTPFIIFFILAILLRKRVNYLYSLVIIITVGGVFTFLFTKFSLTNLLIFNPLDTIWQNIIKSRNPYYYLFNWNYQLLILLADLILFFFIFQESKFIFKQARDKNYAFLLFFIPCIIFALYLITVELFHLHFFIQLQMLRNLSLWKIFSVLFFSLFAYKMLRKNPLNIKSNFFLLGIINSFIFNKSFIYPLPNKESLIWLFLPGFIYVWFAQKNNLPLLKTNYYNIRLVIFLLIILFSFLLSRILSIRIIQILPLVFITLLIALFIKKQANLVIKYQSLIEPVSIFIFIIMISSSLTKFKISPDYQENRPFLLACNWIKINTENNSLFITEPFSEMSSPLRLACFRNIFVSRKDGSFAILFNRAYALEWQKRMDLTHQLLANYQTLPQILSQYHPDYLFSDKQLDINYPSGYHNDKYFIYKLK